MRDTVFFLVVLAFLALGLPLMGGLDRFVRRNRIQRSERLYIGLEHAGLFPLTPARISGSPSASPCYLCESRAQLMQDLSDRRIDVAIVSGAQAVPVGYRRRVFRVSAQEEPSCSLALVWKMSLASKPEVQEFIRHFQERLHAQEPLAAMPT